MSATTIYRKRGDTGPALRAQLLDGNDIEDAVPVDLTGASSAKLVMRKPDTSVLEGSWPLRPARQVGCLTPGAHLIWLWSVSMRSRWR